MKAYKLIINYMKKKIRRKEKYRCNKNIIFEEYLSIFFLFSDCTRNYHLINTADVYNSRYNYLCASCQRLIKKN